MDNNMPILSECEDIGRVPFRFAHVSQPIPNVSTALSPLLPDDDGTRGTKQRGEKISWLALLRFYFELVEDSEDTMPPRPVNRLNWQLIISVMSMSITLLTLLVAGAWSLSSKNTNLDTVSSNIATNTSDIRNQGATLTAIQLSIQELKDSNQKLTEEVAELKRQLQDKKDK